MNSTSINVTYIAATPQERAIVMVTLRPGKFPTEEAHKAISHYLWAVQRLQVIRDC